MIHIPFTSPGTWLIKYPTLVSHLVNDGLPQTTALRGKSERAQHDLAPRNTSETTQPLALRACAAPNGKATLAHIL
jgi:hypothetical protein